MLSDEYWKDKTMDSKQVASAWLLVALLIAGGLYADASVRVTACESGIATRAQSLADSRDTATVRLRDLR